MEIFLHFFDAPVAERNLDVAFARSEVPPGNQALVDEKADPAECGCRPGDCGGAEAGRGRARR